MIMYSILRNIRRVDRRYKQYPITTILNVYDLWAEYNFEYLQIIPTILLLI